MGSGTSNWSFWFGSLKLSFWSVTEFTSWIVLACRLNIDNSEEMTKSVKSQVEGALREKLSDLASKSDIDNLASLIKNMHNDFLTELSLRDAEIESNKNSINELSARLKKSEDTVKDLSNRIASLESPPLASKQIIDAAEFAMDDGPKIDLAIVGSSLVRYVNTEHVNPNGENLLVCRPGAKVSQIRTETLELLASATVNNLILHVGGNNIPEVPPRFLAAEIIDMLHTIRHEFPDVNLHFSAILPKIHPCYLHGINQVNNMVFDACDDLGVNFIFHNAFAITDSTGCKRLNRPLYAPREWENGEPIHISRSGVAQFEIDCKSAL